MTQARKLYLVRRLALRLRDEQTVRTPLLFSERLNTPNDDPRTVPVAVFATAQEAERRARELEREAHRLLNPFWSSPNSIEWKTSLSEADILARLAELGIDAPEERRYGQHHRRNWYRWWEANAPGWSDELLQTVLDLFDLYHLHDVVPVEAEL